MCPHSTRPTDPNRCSLCLGAPARIVTQQGADLLVDGEPAGRTLDTESQRTDYGRAQQRRRKP